MRPDQPSSNSSSVQPRWTIRWKPYTLKANGGWELNGYCNSWPGEEPVPVVPCDDAAVHRVAWALATEDGDRVDFATNAGGLREYHLSRARQLLTAAAQPDAAELTDA